MSPRRHPCDDTPEARETHERILDAAQKLFGEKGLEATSVRDITAAADCNVAAVNYHFGGKENLYLESFRAMLGPLRDQRMAMMDELMARKPAPTLEEYLTGFAEGFLEPLVDESLGRRFMLFVSREISDQKLPTGFFLDEFIRPLIDRAVSSLDRVGVPLNPEQSFYCIFSVIGQLLHAVKGHHMAAEIEATGGPPFELKGFVDHFVRFSAAGIRACASHETTPTANAGGES
ncbi:MAG: CerR family C-terminal domain-containing protein [Thermoanaerobaculales bacterium]|nr:CerR family C-terminal domain-containing protein [Thermoanaerobaculales bacterium]